tara:strand:+ start:7007 stop:7228 length:222 start_codon:yes stop_codon:yes gene_type:complete
LTLGFEAAAYFVANHFKISIQEVWNMSSEAFEVSFVWANAAKRVESEDMKKATDGAKSKSRVGSTHGPMPYSD